MKTWKACGCLVLALGLLLQGCGSNEGARTKTMSSNKNQEKVVLTFYGNKVAADEGEPASRPSGSPE